MTTGHHGLATTAALGHHHPRQRRTRLEYNKRGEPFILLTFKVGCCILSLLWLVTHITLLVSFPNSPSSYSLHTTTTKGLANDRDNAVRNDRHSEEYPEFRLDPQRLKSDAFGIHDVIARSNIQQTGLYGFYEEVSLLKKQFISFYGGKNSSLSENAARYWIHSGLTTFQPRGNINFERDRTFDAYDIQNIPSGLQHTAYRILNARQQNRPFKVAFGGYSVTVGRGNYFYQSYPFVFEKLLTRPMELLGIELQVRNAAIGGVPSFPYGWCLENFLGDDVDVYSWDYSMNEAGGVADGLEAYIRHGLSMKRRPMLIVKDTSVSIAKDRYDLLQSYVDIGVLKDPIVLSLEDATEHYLQVKEDLLPPGFQSWRQFGAPNGAPGQTSHHPGLKEHALYGWLLTMHFLAVLELVAFYLSKNKLDNTLLKGQGSQDQLTLPAPVHGKIISPTESFSLFYGYDTSGPASKPLSWQMNPVHCRTTYDPIVNNHLQDIVVSGTNGEELDIMLPRGAQLYNKGWVLDLGQSEKTVKKKLVRYGGLGYIDSKKAYYGIKASGPLELFLPCIRRDDILQRMQVSSGELPSRECFRNVVVCEVNDKRTGQKCDLNSDLSFLVGGVKSTDSKPINATGTIYWGRNICLRVDVPPESSMTLQKSKTRDGFDIGTSLTISVASSSIMFRSGPCSISHIVWEQTHRIETSQ